MKNKALILTIIAIAAIAFVVWYLVIKKSPSYTMVQRYNMLGAANRLYNCKYYDPEVGYYYQNQTSPCKGSGTYKPYFR